MNAKARRNLAIFSVFTALWAMILVGAAAGQKESFPIDTEGTCISEECHADLGTKKFVHEAASDGTVCTDCHEVKEEGLHSFKLVEEGGELCFMCHDPKGEKKFVHSPVEEGECTECHDPHQSDNPKQLILPPSSELCHNCHDDVGDKSYVHSPVEEGECMECHDPHESDNPGQLVLPPTQELCFECHEGEDFTGSVTHVPVREGDCLECHSPHSTDNPEQLVKPVPELCVLCHGVELLDKAGIAISSEKSLFEAKDANIHKPFAEGKCLECHFPHRSAKHALLKRGYPTLIYSPYSEESYGLCLGCHKEMVEVLVKPRTLTDTKFRNGNLNLHHRHVNKKKGRSCKSCHHHHGTKNPKLIRKAFQFGTMELSLNFEKTETGGGCTPSCHVPVKYDRYEPAKTGMKTSPREGKDATPEELEKSRELDNASEAKKGKPAEAGKLEGK